MLSRAVASVFFEEHRPQKLPIHGLYAGLTRDSCLPCKRYCRAASRAAACRVPVALLVASRVNVPLKDAILSSLKDWWWPGNQLNDLNTLRLRQDGCHFPDDIFKCIFLNENTRISLKKSLKFVPKVRINIIPALVQIMAWRRSGDKPLSEPMMVNLLTHVWVTQPQWVNTSVMK